MPYVGVDEKGLLVARHMDVGVYVNGSFIFKLPRRTIPDSKPELHLLEWL